MAKKHCLNLYADYISSKGKIQYQDYTQMNLKATGSYFTAKNEAYGSVTFSQHDTLFVRLQSYPVQL